MHCVYTAYEKHLEYLGVEIDFHDWLHSDWEYYVYVKELTHGERDCPTWGGIVPTLISEMAAEYDLEAKIEHRIFGGKEYYMGDDMAEEMMLARWIIDSANFGQLVETITLEPAIYLLLADGHATFSETVPVKGVPVMALQLQKKESQDERDVNNDSTNPGSL